MPNSLVTQHYPDDFQVASFHNLNFGFGDPMALLYAERDIVIDSIVLGVRIPGNSAGGGGLSFETSLSPAGDGGTSMCTFNIDGSNNTSAGDTKIATTDSAIRYLADGSVANDSSSKINPDANLVRAGRWLVMDFVGTVSEFRGFIQVRYRSRVA